MLDPAARDMTIMGATIERIARGEVIRKNKNAGLITQAGVLLLHTNRDSGAG